MSHEDDCVERIKKLDRLYLAQAEALAAYHREPSDVNYRRWTFLFERYGEVRNELGMFSNVETPVARRDGV
jgi:hypothetical protein